MTIHEITIDDIESIIIKNYSIGDNLTVQLNEKIFSDFSIKEYISMSLLTDILPVKPGCQIFYREKYRIIKLYFTITKQKFLVSLKPIITWRVRTANPFLYEKEPIKISGK